MASQAGVSPVGRFCLRQRYYKAICEFQSPAGGESIYGGTFNDEDFVRRHTQAATQDSSKCCMNAKEFEVLCG